MKDSRLTIWTDPTSHLTGSTTNTGPTMDLFGGSYPVGISEPVGTATGGIGVEIIQTEVSGTAQVTIWTYEVSEDDVTWRAGGFICRHAIDTADIVLRSRGTIAAGPDFRYVRLVASNTGTGASTSVAYVEDFQGLYAQGASS